MLVCFLLWLHRWLQRRLASLQGPGPSGRPCVGPWKRSSHGGRIGASRRLTIRAGTSSSRTTRSGVFGSHQPAGQRVVMACQGSVLAGRLLYFAAVRPGLDHRAGHCEGRADRLAFDQHLR